MAKLDDEKVVKAVAACMSEAKQGRNHRMQLNKRNWHAYLGQQDWSHKTEEQSTEFLPKVSAAAEQMAAFVKRGLVGMGDWFTVETRPESPISGNQIRTILQHFLGKINTNPYEAHPFSTIAADAVKTGLLESLIVLKIHGVWVEEPVFRVESVPDLGVEGDEPTQTTRRVWKLRVDVIPSDEWYPDPSGKNLYNIHRTEKDLYEVQAMAEAGVYSKEAVAKLRTDNPRTDSDKPHASQKNQSEATKPAFRKKVTIDEFWGTLLADDGSVMMARALCTVANERILLRAPQPFPFWHGEDPFVSAPLIRVPGSVWHKAVYDDATSLNIAMNELYNLMLDGAMAAVWGIRQIHPDMLENPDQVSNGIPPGTTLVLADGVPINAKALEPVFTTTVPPDSLSIFNLTTQEFNASAFTNDVRLGGLPPKQVKATEIMAANQSNAVTLDSVIGDVENEVIEPALRKIWLTLLQNADDMATEDIINAVGVDGAFTLARMTPSQRFMAFGQNQFRVHGLSATLAKANDFQKMMALMQVIGANPLLLQSFFQRFSPDRVLEAFLKFLNINPTSISQTPEEAAVMQDRMANLQQFMQSMGMQQGQGGRTGSLPGIGGGGSTLGGDSGINGEIHQAAEPTGGF